MAYNLTLVETLAQTLVGLQGFELVERKGKGHPDSICDAVAEEISHALCREYTAEFGRILHFNADKAMLVAGRMLEGRLSNRSWLKLVSSVAE